MQDTLTNHEAECKSATPQAENINIIVGCIRATGWSLQDLAGAVGNGAGYIRDGNAFRLISSEAYGQGKLS